MRYVFGPEDTAAAARQFGGKGAALAALQRAGLPIPAWFSLSPEAFHAGDDSLRPDGPVGRELARAVAELCPDGARLAVRSSAGEEDGREQSFAGQLDSFLFVRPEEVADHVAAVWRSGSSERFLAYRRENGLSADPCAPAVLVQRMVDARVSGVAFGADPVTGQRGVAVVAAVYGLGTSLVSGECDADTYHVDREGRIVKRTIACKWLAHRGDPSGPEGVRRVPVAAEDAPKPALGDEGIRAVADLVRRVGECFERPQDIEWAIAEDGRLYLLQSRPITALAGLADPDGARALWDNSNIAESYSGVTTPLTFSFARRAYEEVYRQFCRLMRVPEGRIAASEDTFRRMIGLIRGRIYYNLLSWYRVLSLLPGFSVNRRFMEQMMGVREGLPEDILAELSARATGGERLRDGFRLLNALGGLAVNHARLPRRIRRFYARLERALAPPSPSLEALRADELAAYYRGLERRLLTRWDAPLINDFFAMIFYGLLRRLTETWCGDHEGTLQNDLISGEGGMISAEPAQRVREMARMAAEHPAFVGLLCDGSFAAIRRAMEETSRFRTAYQEYLDRFGDRCLEELKLESATLHDDPLPLLRSVGRLARSGAPRTAGRAGEDDARHRAERRVRQSLARQPLRRALFFWVLKNARGRVRDRENLRFERTRLFGRVRRVFLEIGRRFYASDLLDAPRDVFYLEVEEALGVIDGTATSTNLKGLVAVRKAEFAAYRESPPPDDRFETRGVVCQGNSFCGAAAVERADKDASGVDEDQLQGIGCCPGIVRGPVCVVTDPRTAELPPGAILVAERTDPGWVLLFPAAAGLLVERGSLLSHSAIVAREMGLPAIVSLPGLTGRLREGDRVEMDGSTGKVRRITPAVGAAPDA